MKRLFLSLTLLLNAGLLMASGIVPVPKSQSGNDILVPQYGGYLASTAAFPLNVNSTITIPHGYSEIGIGGIIFSSGPGTTFAEFFSSIGWSPSVQPFLRISNATGTLTNSVGGTEHFYPAPFRVEGSTNTKVFWRVTNGDTSQLHNLITVPYVIK